MFNSIYSDHLEHYCSLRRTILSESAWKHELCYLKRFDDYVSTRLKSFGCISYSFIHEWIRTLSGKSSSKANEIIVVRQFLNYLIVSGERAAIPSVPKVHDDYIPYIFSDVELEQIFSSADNVIRKDPRVDPYLSIEFPVILRLLYCCGLRIGETVRISMEDVDLPNGILRMIHTKGDKHRLVPMASGMTDILTKYCMAMGLLGANTGWLFPSSRNESHISDKAVKRQFESILRENGIYPVNHKKHERGPCLHCMRHVFAFRSFAQAEREGRNMEYTIPFLSIYLGHDSLNETVKYLKFSNELYPESIDIFGEFMKELLPEVDYEA